MRISDWSSDVCSSDLRGCLLRRRLLRRRLLRRGRRRLRFLRQAVVRLAGGAAGERPLAADQRGDQLELLVEAALQLVALHDGAARLLADRRPAVLLVEPLVATPIGKAAWREGGW